MERVYQSTRVRELRSGWTRVDFSQAFRGQPVRPLLRFHRADGPAEEHILPAAVLGRARWIGLAPKDLERLEILTLPGSGEDIRIDGVRAVSELRIARAIAVHHPTQLPRYLYSLCLRRRSRTVLVRSLLDLSSPERFYSFRRTRVRAYEPEGIDSGLRITADGEPSVTFVIIAGPNEGDCRALERTLESLARQIDSSFRILVGLTRGAEEERIMQSLGRSGLAPNSDILDLSHTGKRAERAGLDLACGSSSEWVLRVDPGDILPPEAVLLLRDHIAAHPELKVLYADSISSLGGAVGGQPELEPSIFGSDRLCRAPLPVPKVHPRASSR
jgi:hypothetical protein